MDFDPVILSEKVKREATTITIQAYQRRHINSEDMLSTVLSDLKESLGDPCEIKKSEVFVDSGLADSLEARDKGYLIADVEGKKVMIVKCLTVVYDHIIPELAIEELPRGVTSVVFSDYIQGGAIL